MHEAGIARAIADTLHAEGLVGVPIRVLVTGGHDEPAAFDSSLLFHLGLVAPEVDLGQVSIVHLPSGRWCPSCGHRFEAVGEVDCPACGGATMGSQLDERIEIERADGPGIRDDGPGTPGLGPGSSDPPERADRPSGMGTGEVHDKAMPHQHGDPARERPDDRVT